MSSLINPEKTRLEKLLGMSTGYVLNFSNSSFRVFVKDTVGLDIDSPKYYYLSNSKANKLRKLWMVESDHTVGKLLETLATNWDVYRTADSPISVTPEIWAIIKRLLTGVKQESKSDESLLKLQLAELKNDFDCMRGLPAQQRGYAFEIFLNKFFELHGLNPRSPFKITGEQIDGSFELDNNIYLVEAKWQNAPISQADLLVFHGKLSGKATWARGLFISHSGFSKEGIMSYSLGKQTTMIGLDGQDLFFILDNQVDFITALRQKIRIAAEENQFYFPVSNMIYGCP